MRVFSSSLKEKKTKQLLDKIKNAIMTNISISQNQLFFSRVPPPLISFPLSIQLAWANERPLRPERPKRPVRQENPGSPQRQAKMIPKPKSP